MGVIINPGTGPVHNASVEEARKNIRQFVADLELEGVRVHRHEKSDYDNDYGDGRFCFRLYLNGRRSEIQMPGIPLERVRYTGAEGQNPWHFPRLYESDSSWLWGFAINMARHMLTRTELEF